MKRIGYIYAVALLFALYGCRSLKTDRNYISVSRYDSLFFKMENKMKETNTSYVSRHIIVDTLRLIKLPVEQSESIGKRQSRVETSLAISEAYIDSSGVLHHSIRNKDTALLPQRNVTTEVTSDTSKVIKNDSEIIDKTKSQNATKEIKTKTIKSYINMKLLVLIGILLAVGYLEMSTPFKPISIIRNLFNKLKRK